MKKLCGPIKGLYAPPNLICFIAWFIGHDVILKRPTLLHHFQHVFFFFFPLQVERLMLLQAYRNIFSLLHKHLCWWFQCNVLFFFFFIRSIWATLLNLSMITFLWKCCLYHCDIFLPTFCQYLVWEVAYYPLYPSFFLFPPLPFGHVMFLSLASGKSSQSGLVFPIGGRVCVHRHLVCASLQCFFVHHLTHNSHIHLFCIDLTPKF